MIARLDSDNNTLHCGQKSINTERLSYPICRSTFAGSGLELSSVSVVSTRIWQGTKVVVRAETFNQNDAIKTRRVDVGDHQIGFELELLQKLQCI